MSNECHITSLTQIFDECTRCICKPSIRGDPLRISPGSILHNLKKSGRHSKAKKCTRNHVSIGRADRHEAMGTPLIMAGAQTGQDRAQGAIEHAADNVVVDGVGVHTAPKDAR